MKLSEHFTLDEFTISATARRKGILNIPNDTETENLRLLCVNVLEPIRALIGIPIHIDSGFRCEALNEAVGGVPDSQHRLGEAADLITDLTPEELFQKIIASNVPFDQVIQEFNEWVHISYRVPPRKDKQRATKDSNGNTVYVNV